MNTYIKPEFEKQIDSIFKSKMKQMKYKTLK